METAAMEEAASEATTAMEDDLCFAIKLQAINLPHLDQVGSIDPYVTIENNEDDQIARTRFLSNDQNPIWPTIRVPIDRLSFAMPRDKSDSLKVVFNVYNYKIIKANEYVGSVCVEVGDLYEIEETGQPMGWVLDDQENPDCMLFIKEVILVHNTLQLENISDVMIDTDNDKGAQKLLKKLSKEKDLHIIVKFSAIGLKNTDLIGKSDPYLEVWTLKPQMLRKTEWLRNNLNPSWKAFSITQRSFAPNWKFHNLVFKIFDRDLIGKNDLIGQAECNSKVILSAALQKKSLVWRLYELSQTENSAKGNPQQELTGRLKLEFAIANKDLTKIDQIRHLADESVLYRTVDGHKSSRASSVASYDGSETESPRSSFLKLPGEQIANLNALAGGQSRGPTGLNRAGSVAVSQFKKMHKQNYRRASGLPNLEDDLGASLSSMEEDEGDDSEETKKHKKHKKPKTLSTAVSDPEQAIKKALKVEPEVIPEEDETEEEKTEPKPAGESSKDESKDEKEPDKIVVPKSRKPSRSVSITSQIVKKISVGSPESEQKKSSITLPIENNLLVEQPEDPEPYEGMHISIPLDNDDENEPSIQVSEIPNDADQKSADNGLDDKELSINVPAIENLKDEKPFDHRERKTPVVTNFAPDLLALKVENDIDNVKEKDENEDDTSGFEDSSYTRDNHSSPGQSSGIEEPSADPEPPLDVADDSIPAIIETDCQDSKSQEPNQDDPEITVPIDIKLETEPETSGIDNKIKTNANEHDDFEKASELLLEPVIEDKRSEPCETDIPVADDVKSNEVEIDDSKMTVEETKTYVEPSIIETLETEKDPEPVELIENATQEPEKDETNEQTNENLSAADANPNDIVDNSTELNKVAKEETVEIEDDTEIETKTANKTESAGVFSEQPYSEKHSDDGNDENAVDIQKESTEPKEENANVSSDSQIIESDERIIESGKEEIKEQTEDNAQKSSEPDEIPSPEEPKNEDTDSIEPDAEINDESKLHEDDHVGNETENAGASVADDVTAKEETTELNNIDSQIDQNINSIDNETEDTRNLEISNNCTDLEPDVIKDTVSSDAEPYSEQPETEDSKNVDDVETPERTPKISVVDEDNNDIEQTGKETSPDNQKTISDKDEMERIQDLLNKMDRPHNFTRSETREIDEENEIEQQTVLHLESTPNLDHLAKIEEDAIKEKNVEDSEPSANSTSEATLDPDDISEATNHVTDDFQITNDVCKETEPGKESENASHESVENENVDQKLEHADIEPTKDNNTNDEAKNETDTPYLEPTQKQEADEKPMEQETNGPSQNDSTASEEVVNEKLADVEIPIIISDETNDKPDDDDPNRSESPVNEENDLVEEELFLPSERRPADNLECSMEISLEASGVVHNAESIEELNEEVKFAEQASYSDYISEILGLDEDSGKETPTPQNDDQDDDAPVLPETPTKLNEDLEHSEPKSEDVQLFENQEADQSELEQNPETVELAVSQSEESAAEISVSEVTTNSNLLVDKNAEILAEDKKYGDLPIEVDQIDDSKNLPADDENFSKDDPDACINPGAASERRMSDFDQLDHEPRIQFSLDEDNSHEASTPREEIDPSFPTEFRPESPCSSIAPEVGSPRGRETPFTADVESSTFEVQSFYEDEKTPISFEEPTISSDEVNTEKVNEQSIDSPNQDESNLDTHPNSSDKTKVEEPKTEEQETLAKESNEQTDMDNASPQTEKDSENDTEIDEENIQKVTKIPVEESSKTFPEYDPKETDTDVAHDNADKLSDEKENKEQEKEPKETTEQQIYDEINDNEDLIVPASDDDDKVESVPPLHTSNDDTEKSTEEPIEEPKSDNTREQNDKAEIANKNEPEPETGIEEPEKPENDQQISDDSNSGHENTTTNLDDDCKQDSEKPEIEENNKMEPDDEIEAETVPKQENNETESKPETPSEQPIKDNQSELDPDAEISENDKNEPEKETIEEEENKNDLEAEIDDETIEPKTETQDECTPDLAIRLPEEKKPSENPETNQADAIFDDVNQEQENEIPESKEPEQDDQRQNDISEPIIENQSAEIVKSEPQNEETSEREPKPENETEEDSSEQEKEATPVIEQEPDSQHKPKTNPAKSEIEPRDDENTNITDVIDPVSEIETANQEDNAPDTDKEAKDDIVATPVLEDGILKGENETSENAEIEPDREINHKNAVEPDNEIEETSNAEYNTGTKEDEFEPELKTDLEPEVKTDLESEVDKIEDKPTLENNEQVNSSHEPKDESKDDLVNVDNEVPAKNTETGPDDEQAKDTEVEPNIEVNGINNVELERMPAGETKTEADNESKDDTDPKTDNESQLANSTGTEGDKELKPEEETKEGTSPEPNSEETNDELNKEPTVVSAPKSEEDPSKEIGEPESTENASPSPDNNTTDDDKPEPEEPTKEDSRQQSDSEDRETNPEKNHEPCPEVQQTADINFEKQDEDEYIDEPSLDTENAVNNYTEPKDTIEPDNAPEIEETKDYPETEKNIESLDDDDKDPDQIPSDVIQDEETTNDPIIPVDDNDQYEEFETELERSGEIEEDPISAVLDSRPIESNRPFDDEDLPKPPTDQSEFEKDDEVEEQPVTEEKGSHPSESNRPLDITPDDDTSSESDEPEDAEPEFPNKDLSSDNEPEKPDIDQADDPETLRSRTSSMSELSDNQPTENKNDKSQEPSDETPVEVLEDKPKPEETTKINVSINVEVSRSRPSSPQDPTPRIEKANLSSNITTEVTSPPGKPDAFNKYIANFSFGNEIFSDSPLSEPIFEHKITLEKANKDDASPKISGPDESSPKDEPGPKKTSDEAGPSKKKAEKPKEDSKTEDENDEMNGRSPTYLIMALACIATIGLATLALSRLRNN